MAPCEWRRVLVVKLSALGDVVHALPAVDYLRRAAPGVRVDWAVDRRFASLLEGNPDLGRVVPLDIGRWRHDWMTARTRREAAAAIAALRAEEYDAAFDIQGNLKSGVVTRLSGAPVRFGFARDGVREMPNLLFTNRKVRLREEDRHVSEKILRVVSAPFGGVFRLPDLRSAIPATEEEENRARRAVEEASPGACPRLAVHAGTTWVTKRMDPSFWVEAVRALRARFPRLGVLLSWGSDEERREAEEIRDRAGAFAGLLPGLSLRELAAAYRRCGYMMAPDTGPLHIAAAAGAATVSVFRATAGARNAPAGPAHRFLQAPMDCRACLKKRCGRDAECRASLSPEDAARAMAALMEESAARDG